MADETKPVGNGRIILAFILDLLTSFMILGYIIAKFAGQTTEGGFELSGLPAAIFFILIFAYFLGLGRYGGGTIWQRILKTKR